MKALFEKGFKTDFLTSSFSDVFVKNLRLHKLPNLERRNNPPPPPLQLDRVSKWPDVRQKPDTEIDKRPYIGYLHKYPSGYRQI